VGTEGIKMMRIRRAAAAGLCAVICMSISDISAQTAGRAKIPAITREPYVGAVALDFSTGKAIYEASADVKCYPASLVKMMTLYLVLEKIETGSLKLTDPILTTAEASRIGGSSVYLKEKEVFPVDELLYATIVCSACDAAAALAIHIAGSRAGFVELMNQKAKQLGMNNTEFGSVHGLPPEVGQKPDVSTARDMANLSLELVRRFPQALKYTSTVKRGFRNGKFIMDTHNPLLKTVQGCDGLKTGWTRSAGYSISATALRNDRRVIAVVMGSTQKVKRDTKAKELLAYAFMNLPPTNMPPPVVAAADMVIDPDRKTSSGGKDWASSGKVVLWVAGILLLVFVIARLALKRFDKYASSDSPFLKK
jgi:serine-type D-Ala-D-Ala carboxypeptidase (penicillin-binding protein 5/6)